MNNFIGKRSSTFNLLYSFWKHLSRKRRIQIIALLAVMLMSSIAELISLASLIPFLTLVADPEKIWRFQIIKKFTDYFQIKNDFNLLLFFSITFGSTALIASIIRLTNVWLNHKTVAAIGSDLSVKAYKLTLYQPYTVHIKRNSSKVISALSSQIDYTQYLIGFTLQLITNTFISFGILIGIFLANWQIALFAFFVIGGNYLIVVKNTKKILLKNSKFIANSMNIQIKNLQEGLGGIRDIILDGSQKTFINIYSKNDIPRRNRQANNQFFQQFPKLILESLTLIFVSIICVILVSNSTNKGEIVTILGTLALGAQKLLPASQQIYSSWVGIKANSAPAQEVLMLLDQEIKISDDPNNSQDLKFDNFIELKNISYGYSPKKLILKNIDLKIKKGEIIGIIGSTGSGKSTLADLIMGLLKPTKGELLVDGIGLYKKDTNKNIHSWRRNISHIPQNIFLKDGTIYENIAFGTERKLVNKTRVRKVAKLAMISEFIENKLGGYKQFVGEKGIKLSGGQLQRIGIARALYKESALLVLDESTSSLDLITEKKIINAILKLENKPTIIMIAHRLNTLLNCDRIMQIENGKLVKEGKAEDIISSLSKQIDTDKFN